jgi:cation diffusion facilitator CzcD-associated flavoprotein CzcO
MMSIVIGQKMKDSNIEFVIYERNSDLGGTWLENRFVKTWRDTLSWW